MFTSSISLVYWLFRIYAGCVLLAGVLHAVALASDTKSLHRGANYVLLGGILIGFVPLLAALVHALVQRLRRNQTK